MAQNPIYLPAPHLNSSFSVERALHQRRSIREYSDQAVTIEQAAQLLWACQGITSTSGFRTAPSAGALYPLEVFLIADRIDGVPAGLYHYRQAGIGQHSLQLLESGELTERLAESALGQDCIRKAAINILICAVPQRTTAKYGARAERYVWIEAGHAAQNVCLQVQSLGLGVATVGAIHDEKVKKAFDLTEEPLYILSVGVPLK